MKTLIQGGWVVGFDGKEHEIIKDGVVVFDSNQVEFVGKDYAQAVDKKIDAKGCLVSPGFIDTHFHSGINASDYILNDSTKTDFFASNYLAHGGPTRGSAVRVGGQLQACRVRERRLPRREHRQHDLAEREARGNVCGGRGKVGRRSGGARQSRDSADPASGR